MFTSIQNPVLSVVADTVIAMLFLITLVAIPLRVIENRKDAASYSQGVP